MGVAGVAAIAIGLAVCHLRGGRRCRPLECSRSCAKHTRRRAVVVRSCATYCLRPTLRTGTPLLLAIRGI